MVLDCHVKHKARLVCPEAIRLRCPGIPRSLRYFEAAVPISESQVIKPGPVSAVPGDRISSLASLGQNFAHRTMGKTYADQVIIGWFGIEPFSEISHVPAAAKRRWENDSIIAHFDGLGFISDDDVRRQGKPPEPAPWRLGDGRIMISWQQHPRPGEGFQGDLETP